MAYAVKYSMWSHLSEKSVSAVTSILGPDYSYSDHIKPPSSMGVGSSGTFSQIGRNVNGILYYVGTLITGNPPLGNQFYINTGGTCTGPDGQLKPRFNFINNKSSGENAVPASMKELGAGFNGLIPGVVSDIGGLNPTYIFSSIASDVSPACKCYQCGQAPGFKYLTPSLSPDFNLKDCKEVDSSKCESPEQFSNMHEDKAVPTILAGLVLAYFVFSGK
jgi:hypothetical protein